MTVITMTRKELAGLQTLIDLADGRITVDDAAALMGLGRPQVYRLLDAFRADGPDAMVSKRRGKPSNRAHGDVFRKTALGIVRDRYVDFGPTLRRREAGRGPRPARRRRDVAPVDDR
jgi:hypothetical protein